VRADGGAAGAGVLCDVGQRLGDDEVGGRLDRGGEPARRHSVADRHRHSRRQGVHSGAQSALGEDRWEDPVGQLAQVFGRRCAWSSASFTSGAPVSSSLWSARRASLSVIIGGTVGGMCQAIIEETITDGETGRIANATFGNYPIPVNADVPDMKWSSSENRTA
jgi:hypothetical protein